MKVMNDDDKLSGQFGYNKNFSTTVSNCESGNEAKLIHLPFPNPDNISIYFQVYWNPKL